jgi:class 3 adenylate cyclase
MTAALVLGAAAFSAIAAAALWRGRREIRRLRGGLERSAEELHDLQEAFRRFAPNEVIEGLIQGTPPSPEKRDVTVLFADLVGFTALSERVEPAVLVRILNGYFERMSAALTENRGHVSKFVGDGILALFGALAPNPWQADDAVRAALSMRAALADYNQALAAEGLPRLAVGIGIERGPVIAGLIGTRHLIEFTVVGRPVNLAARVQAVTREHHVDILVTEHVRVTLDPQIALRALPPLSLKGVREPVAVWAVMGPADRVYRPAAVPSGRS